MRPINSIKSDVVKTLITVLFKITIRTKNISLLWDNLTKVAILIEQFCKLSTKHKSFRKQAVMERFIFVFLPISSDWRYIDYKFYTEINFSES